MKPHFTNYCIIATSLLIAQPSFGQIINGDFESGLAGWTYAMEGGKWTLGADYYETAVPAPLSPTELAYHIVTSPPSLGGNTFVGTQTLATGGNCGWLCGPENQKNSWSVSYTDSEGHLYYWWPNGSRATLSQSFFLGGGQSVTGQAQFETQDFVPFWYDHASVRVTGSGEDTEIWYANVTLAYQLDPNHSYYAITPWLDWAWTAPSDGIYTLILDEGNDDQLYSKGYFDNIAIVPEPSSFGLCSLAVVLGMWVRRRGHARV
jgi:hypothetical protein